jgi:hypothetical protein
MDMGRATTLAFIRSENMVRMKNTIQSTEVMQLLLPVDCRGSILCRYGLRINGEGRETPSPAELPT